MKYLCFSTILIFLFSCSKSSTSSTSSDSGSFTMKTKSGILHTSNKFSRTRNITNNSFGTVYFNADPNDSYRKFYYFECDFDEKNDAALDITLNGTNVITQTGSAVLSSVTIDGKWFIPDRTVVYLTSNLYPGKITGTYTFYSNLNGLICSGSFDYTVK
jgi:hypothetical protein